MANLQYTSIIRLLLHCDADINAPIQLSRVRKQIVAEFAVAKDGFIEIDGYSYNKNDVLEELDRPDFEDRLPMHLIVWKQKQILELFEKESINMDTIGQEMNDYRKDEKFVAFASPYFKTAFNNMCRSLLYPPQLAVLGVFLKMQQFITPQDQEEAFSSIHKYLLEQDRLFRNTTMQNYNLNRNDLLPWRSGDFSSFLNLLPDSFYELKENIVIHLINTSVSTQNTYSEDAKAYSAEMVKLTGIDAEHKQLILSNNQVFNGNKGIGASGGGTNYWWVLWLAIALVRLVGMGGC